MPRFHHVSHVVSIAFSKTIPQSRREAFVFAIVCGCVSFLVHVVLRFATISKPDNLLPSNTALWSFFSIDEDFLENEDCIAFVRGIDIF